MSVGIGVGLVEGVGFLFVSNFPSHFHLLCLKFKGEESNGEICGAHIRTRSTRPECEHCCVRYQEPKKVE